MPAEHGVRLDDEEPVAPSGTAILEALRPRCGASGPGFSVPDGRMSGRGLTRPGTKQGPSSFPVGVDVVDALVIETLQEQLDCHQGRSPECRRPRCPRDRRPSVGSRNRRTIARANSAVEAAPPRSRVRTWSSRKVWSMAARSRRASPARPTCSSIMAAASSSAVGLATPWPAMSGAEPCTASKIAARSPMLAPGATPAHPPARRSRPRGCRRRDWWSR